MTRGNLMKVLLLCRAWPPGKQRTRFTANRLYWAGAAPRPSGAESWAGRNSYWWVGRQGVTSERATYRYTLKLITYITQELFRTEKVLKPCLYIYLFISSHRSEQRRPHSPSHSHLQSLSRSVNRCLDTLQGGMRCHIWRSPSLATWDIFFVSFCQKENNSGIKERSSSWVRLCCSASAVQPTRKGKVWHFGKRAYSHSWQL